MEKHLQEIVRTYSHPLSHPEICSGRSALGTKWTQDKTALVVAKAIARTLGNARNFNWSHDF